MSAARRTRIDAPDVKAVREQIGLSQSEFAQLGCTSASKNLQNWEQHRRNPTGPAAALLKIVTHCAGCGTFKALHARMLGYWCWVHWAFKFIQISLAKQSRIAR